MTKVIMNIENGNIMFDCANHSDDHDACTIISTLCNVLVEATYRVGREPTIYNTGHVRIDLFKADEQTIYLFRTVYAVIEHAARQNPEYIKLY